MNFTEIQDRYDAELKEYEALLHLKRSVKMTRINRINAATRLLQTEDFLQGVNIYYSCFSAILSVFSLLTENKSLSIWSTVMTICLAISIVYLNAQKYGNRSQELKTNYIALHGLLFEIEIAESKNEEYKFTELSQKYCKLLQTSENHIRIDYLTQKKESKELCGLDMVEYWIHFVSKWGFRIVIIGFPIMITMYMMLQGVFDGIFV